MNLKQIVLSVLHYQERGITDPQDLIQALLPEYDCIVPDFSS
jgi:hypothetical protein